MACATIHLAIAKKYLEQHQSLNYREVIAGTLYPDYEQFCKDLYFAYDHLNLYLSEKFNITKNDYIDYLDEYYPGVPYKECKNHMPVFNDGKKMGMYNEENTICFSIIKLNSLLEEIKRANVEVGTEGSVGECPEERE